MELAKNSKYLKNLHSQFSLLREGLDVVYFYEEYATPTPAGAKLVSQLQF